MWLVDDADLDDMYTQLGKKLEITLWCHVRQEGETHPGKEDKRAGSKKRPLKTDSSANEKASKKRVTCEQTLTEVEKIAKALKENMDPGIRLSS